MSDEVRVPPGGDLGQRISVARQRRGLSRAAAAALCGRSEEWLRAIERGRRGISLRMIARLAEVLRLDDLTELLGAGAPTVLYARPRHQALAAIRSALAAQTIDAPPAGSDPLRARVEQGWQLRAASRHDRTDLAGMLPDLILDARHAVQHAPTAAAREDAHRMLAEVYHLGQLYLCYQDANELLWVIVDRAMTAALESGDPTALGQAAWFAAYLYRDCGAVDLAHQVVEDTLRTLDRTSADLALPRRLAYLAAACNHARDRRPALAWRAFDQATDADDGPDLRHGLFGTGCAEVALTLDVELGQARSAIRRAEATDVDTVDSVPRRTRLMIEAARGYQLGHEPVAALHLLSRAHQVSPEATVYSMHARALAHDLVQQAGPLHRREAAELASQLHAES